MIIGGVAAFAVLYAMAPDAQELQDAAEEPPSATQIFWAPEEEGAEPEVAVTTGDVQRVTVTREEIPPAVVNGVLAAEQRSFYEDGGINFRGIGRAVVTGGSAGGGSTITQQMARNYYTSELSTEQTISRKIKEIFIAIKLDQQVPKDEILTTYLNTIYFGRGASGVEMAAERYFDKDLDELTDAEGAFLGAIIQQPSRFENVKEGDGYWYDYLTGERWDYMREQLALMYEETGGERGLPRDEAMALELPERVEYNPEATGSGDPKFGYVRQEVINEIIARYDGVDAQALATGGYQVQTSLDPDLMDAARMAFDEALPAVAGFDQSLLMEGLTAVDNETGQILAFHGGDDVVTDPENSLTHVAQAGSSYKPYVLVTALKQNISMETTFNGDSPQTFAGVGEVSNADHRSRGAVNLIESTADSINTSYVHAAEVVTAPAVEQTAIDLGVNPIHTESSTTSPLIALGTHVVSTYDQANAYSTIANGGTSIPAHMVVELRDGKGNEVEPNDADALQGDRVISPDIAADATYAMRQVVEAGGGGRAALADGRPVAGKTGTSSNAVSAWFVGYTPQVTTAVSLSRHDNGKLAFEGIPNTSVFGGTTSALVWKHFMDTAMAGMEVRDFPPRANVGEVEDFGPSPSPSPSESPSEEPSEEPSPSPSNDDVCDPDRPGNGNPNNPNNPDCPDGGDPGECDPTDPLCEEPDPGGGDDDCDPIFDWNCPDPTEDPTDEPTDDGGGDGGGTGTGTGRPGGGTNAMIRPSRED